MDARRRHPFEHTTRRVSLVVNTACVDPAVTPRKNPFRSRPYSDRAELLATEVLPRAGQFDETIVSGVFPAGLESAFPFARFLPVPSVRHDRWDALLQRETAARFTTGDIIVFCHDDHAPGEGLAEFLRALSEDVDILVPKRVHLRTRDSLDNGAAGNYMGGHCYAMRRWIWAAVPLTSAPDEYWDIHLTPVWREAGARIAWTDAVCHYDCEATSGES